MKKILILGATGSVGTQALRVIEKAKDLSVEALVAHKNVDLLRRQVAQTGVQKVGIYDGDAAKKFESFGLPCKVYQGEEGVMALIEESQAQMVLSAIVGIAGLKPTMKAIDEGKNIAFANKETLVTAGDLVMAKVKEKNTLFLPVDSEHAAIHQCLCHEPQVGIQKLMLTASGGPFRTRALDSFSAITREDALRHPTWSMGEKISIDSATMMNKALEVIEAHYLFDTPYEKIEALIHPQSVVHSMVAFKDGNILAQMGHTTMEIPIGYALHYPDRADLGLSEFDFSKQTLSFEPLDEKRYPLYGLGRQAALLGTGACVTLNAANEAAVDLFLRGRIGFLEIMRNVEKALGKFSRSVSSLSEILALDQEVKAYVYAG